MKKGTKCMMADITYEQQRSMQLTWIWEAGKKIIYKRPIPFNKHEHYSIKRAAPASIYVLPNMDYEETIWIYDEYVVEDCIWW